MSVVIHVEKCTECPYAKQSGPNHFCHHPDIGGRPIAFRVPMRIPDFCPLESTEDYCEAHFDIDRDFDNPTPK